MYVAQLQIKDSKKHVVITVILQLHVNDPVALVIITVIHYV